MHILQVLAPSMMLIALGAGLAWIRFLGKPFIGELNKLAFWIALPSLVFPHFLFKRNRKSANLR